MMDRIPAHETPPAGATACLPPFVMPPAVPRPALPDDVLALLIEAHSHHLRMARLMASYLRAVRVPDADLDDEARAGRVRIALYNAGYRDLADRLAAEAAGIVAVPDEQREV